ncbi:PilN domain-containing protein [Candidatus Gottesmanbacteria bacterium]|nr:PilN domain-containing protein [Candidatus Gottesmanbacteria bacterium]
MPASAKPIKINLLSREDFESTFLGQFLHWALSYGRYIIIFTQIIVLSVFFSRFILDREHIDLKESVEQKQALIQSISDVENEIRKIQDRLKKIKDIDTIQTVPLNVINFIQNITPLDIFFTQVTLGKDSIKLIGVSRNLGSLSSLLYQLKRSNKFSEITLDEIVRNSDSSVEFSIGVEFNPKNFET